MWNALKAHYIYIQALNVTLPFFLIFFINDNYSGRLKQSICALKLTADMHRHVTIYLTQYKLQDGYI